MALRLSLQVLLLDADSQPLLDPASLFELDTFQKYGNIFWPDYWAEGFSEVSPLLVCPAESSHACCYHSKQLIHEEEHFCNLRQQFSAQAPRTELPERN